jgi:phage-related protein
LIPSLCRCGCGTWAFTAALLANPITWIVIAIMALVGVFVLLWTKCKWFRDALKAIWNGIKQGVLVIWDFIKGYFKIWWAVVSTHISHIPLPTPIF